MSENQLEAPTNNSGRNIIIAIAAIALSVALFIGLQTETNGTSLEAQVKKSVTLDVALNNGKPTLTEFYADWCTSCQAMAADLATVKENYGDRVNFVMLNVDNTKWLPEILRYRVDGIPHFVFMNSTGDTVAETIGEQPLSILEADLDALVANNPIPYANINARTSQFTPPVTVDKNDDPRSHGAQVK